VVDYPGEILGFARLELDVALSIRDPEVVWRKLGHFGGCVDDSDYSDWVAGGFWVCYIFAVCGLCICFEPECLCLYCTFVPENVFVDALRKRFLLYIVPSFFAFTAMIFNGKWKRSHCKHAMDKLIPNHAALQKISRKGRRD
jgi:hypothetical protein